MITQIIDNFSGRLTRENIGELNSGLAKYTTTFGNDPFTNIGNLTWLENAVQINPNGDVITDLIMAAKPRLENGLTYVYAIGHTGRLYKIQVNDVSTLTPNFDNAVLLNTLTINSPTFKYGSSIQFYGATEKLYIGHDKGVTSVNYDGTGEAFIGVLGSYTANVPRPSANFLGVSYWGNGANILAIDSTGTVTTYAKFSPGFPVGTYVRDLDISPNGNYLQIIVSRLNSPDLTSASQDTTSLSSTDSYKFLWNGTDTGYTASETYGGYSINSNASFGTFNYTMGYDLGGTALYSSGNKIKTLPNVLSPNFEALFSTGNLLGFASPEINLPMPNFSGPGAKANIMFFGQYDSETPKGLFRFLRKHAIGSETDVIQIPVCLTVSNLFYGASSSGYPNNQVGAAKVYFSTLETSATTTKYKFFYFTTVPTGTGTAIGGVYETQNETSVKLFRSILKKKLKAYEVRIYTQPLVTNNSFQIDLIGNDGNPIANTTYTFNVGTTVTSGATAVMYNPQMAPDYSVGLRITNIGIKNWICNKVEIDLDEAGK